MGLTGNQKENQSRSMSTHAQGSTLSGVLKITFGPRWVLRHLEGNLEDA